jgi:hypothetical protein
MKYMFVAAALAIILAPGLARAHGTVGDYTFLEPLVADDANPKNEFDILRPAWYRTVDGRSFGVGFSLEKMLVKDSDGNGIISLETASEWIADSPKAGSYRIGFNDLEILLKWAFLTIPDHEFRLSIGARTILPTGNPSVQDQNHTQFGPEFLWAKGWGDLPDWSLIRYLRPFGFQGDYGYTPALGGATYHEMFADNVVEYSLPYLSNAVEDIGLQWPLRNLYLFTEFNYDQIVTGPNGSTFPQIRITPGLAFMSRSIQISLGTQLPLNSATVAQTHAAVLGLLDLFVDDIFPWTQWTPL